MKKIFCLLLSLSVSTSAFAGSYVDKQLKEAKKNAKYQTVKIHTQTLDDIKIDTDSYKTISKINNLKDPKLIKLSDAEPIDNKLYEQKLAQDEKIYEKEIKPSINKKLSYSTTEPIAVDLYKLYRITERLIRANNLEHTSWRIALIKDTENVNAYATDGNLIAIYTALYDSVVNNEDALAMVIAHEMSHNLLGHQQRQAEMIVKYEKLSGAALSTNGNSADAITASAGLLATSGALVYKKHLFNEIKMMEFMADTEGLNLLIKAGYNPDEAIYTLKFLETLPNIKRFFETHPIAAERLKSAKENIALANPNWVEEGKLNIYNSNVLPVKRSSDKISIVISNDDTISQHYSPESLEQKLTRLAYVNYTKGNMQDAAKYFDKLTEVTNSYIPYLYLSYANEYLYKQTKDSKYQKRAQKAIEQAYALNPSDEYVKEQKQNL